jgi:hypothetical protein
MQQVTTNTFDPSNFAAILDHDTNVFYAYSGGHIFSLDMASLKAASSAPIPWQDAQTADLSPDPSDLTPGDNTAGYQPVMALAQNHIQFLGIPGFSPGSAKIFVIHFSFMQPTPQSFGNFPTTHGKTASFFLDTGVQQEFAFIPDDGSATYVINVETNTTKTLTGPTQDAFATYSASTSALVQLSTSGKVSFLAYNPNTTTSGGSWTLISQLPQALFTSGSTTSASGSASGSSPTSTSSSSSSTNGASKSASSSIRTIAGSGDVRLMASMALGVLLGFVGLAL